jgi:hypothetical protein
MDPDAKVQVPTKGTKLEYSTNDGTTWTRVYGLASTPDIGGQPNMIDTTTLDNTVAETSTVGLQPAAEVSYEFNVQDLVEYAANANIRQIKTLADNKTKAKWRLTKASGITIEYEAVPSISYSADESGGLEKFVMYHDLKSDMTITIPDGE